MHQPWWIGADVESVPGMRSPLEERLRKLHEICTYGLAAADSPRTAEVSRFMTIFGTPKRGICDFLWFRCVGSLPFEWIRGNWVGVVICRNCWGSDFETALKTLCFGLCSSITVDVTTPIVSLTIHDLSNMSRPVIDDTFAEAFPMVGTRLIITAIDLEMAYLAASEFCGNASSVIGCDAEAGIEKGLGESKTPDGRPGVSVLAFAFNRKSLEKAVASRVGQNVLTCPTTACYSGLTSAKDERIKVGAQLRYFGDGFQISKKLGTRRYWRIPVMDGEFLCEDVLGTQKGIGGGNLLVCGDSQATALAAIRAAVTAINDLDDVILPFPAGIVRSGSKVGSKYPQLKASTNDKWCPTLTSQTETDLREGERAVYEIVIDGFSEEAVAGAMKSGLETAAKMPGVTRISAGNYGGKLGPHHFHLHKL